MEENAGEVFMFSYGFSFSVERLYRAWTEIDRLREWWGPKGFELTRCALDFRRGGVFHYCLRDPDGCDMWGKWVITRVLPRRRLEFIVSFCDESAGDPVPHPYEPHWPLEVASEVRFQPTEGGTRLEVLWTPLNAGGTERRVFAARHDDCRRGWTGTMERLERYLLNEGKVLR